jgi:hypothetical protein
MALPEAMVYIRQCNYDPTNIPVGGVNAGTCIWGQVPISVLQPAATVSAEDLTSIANGIIYIVVLVFIIGVIKKVIEM